MNLLARHHPLDHRVPAGRDLEHRSSSSIVGPHVALARGDFGERGQHVELGQRARGALDPADRRADRRAQRVEQLALRAIADPLLGAEDLAPRTP